VTHGGIVATILDEVMGWALASADSWGFTARLTIEYRRPTPIGRLLRAEGRLVGRRRRLLTTKARLMDVATGELLATADALYVAAPPERKQALKDRYRFRLIPEGGAGADPALDVPREVAR
jgi:acyl-coenzyme A thioesterase PaaI-like protein